VITLNQAKQKLGVSISLHLTSEALRLPEIQGVYGAGSKQTYDPGADTNLGPRFDSGISLLQNGSPGYSIGQGQVLPFEFRYNLNDFFRRYLIRFRYLVLMTKPILD
jgi:hypothetical protein